MDRRMYHRPNFYNNNYQLTGTSMENLHVLPTGTNIKINDNLKNTFMADWLSDPNDTTILYVFEKHVPTKNVVFSAIASAGDINLVIGRTYMLKHDQTDARICKATLRYVIGNDELRDTEHYGVVGTIAKSMSLMVFK